MKIPARLHSKPAVRSRIRPRVRLEFTEKFLIKIGVAGRSAAPLNDRLRVRENESIARNR
jgi:hypothetical protein